MPPPQPFSRRHWIKAVSLLAVFAGWPPVMFLAEVGLNHQSLWEAARGWLWLAVALAGIAGVLWSFQRRRSPAWAASVAGTGAIVAFYFPAIHATLAAVDVTRPRYVLLAWVGLLLVATAIGWNIFTERSAQTTLLVGGLGLLLLPVVNVARTSSRGVTGWADVPIVSGAPVAPINVYHLIVDAYGRADQLAKVLGHDNSAFLTAMRDRGFLIGRSSYANYSVTRLSLAALLDMRYPLEQGRSDVDDPMRFRLTLGGHNTTVRQFRVFGYRYVHARSGYGLSNCLGREDLCLRRPDTLPVIESWLLGRTVALTVHDKLKLSWVAPLAEIPDVFKPVRLSTPFFLFAHVLAPHDPYRFTGTCAPTAPPAGDPWAPERRDEYLAMLQCVNRQIVAAVDDIVRRDPAAIIVVQSDHGTAFSRQFDRPFDEWTSSDIEERFAVLNAIRLPRRCHRDWYDSISLVNTYPLVFGCLTGTSPRLLPDRSYFASYRGHPGSDAIVRAR